MKTIRLFPILCAMTLFTPVKGEDMPPISDAEIQAATAAMTERFGTAHRERIETGVRQVASLWRQKDGDSDQFRDFCLSQFIVDPDVLERTVARFETNLESIDGHFLEINRDLSEPMQLDIGPMLPVDYRFAEYSPWAHLNDDLFKIGVAFTALLNFPLTDLDTRLREGSRWSRRRWAESRLVQRFETRLPAEISQILNTAYVQADDYISNYNIYMHQVVTGSGNRLFPEGLKLISHWGLRDELKGRYGDPEGLEKQRLIRRIMEAIITQKIPRIVVNNPDVDWHIDNGTVTAPDGHSLTHDREPDTRYRHLLTIFNAERRADPYYPTLPTKIDRRFQSDREIPESQVESLFVSVLESDVLKKTAGLIKKRLGRPLEPFDIWYNGFQAGGSMDERELDRIVQEKYPDIQSFEKDIPRILSVLGFDEETAAFLGDKIEVDPARGAGHAMGAERREDNAHLRTRVPRGGMNYKGYNIACHELGHNVEQVLSLNRIDHTLLSGVPNTAFTEAFAFVFQSRDLEILGMANRDPASEHLAALDDLWSTAEIAGVSLVDMRVWRWMYAHPEATPAQTKEAVIAIARDVWNTYFQPLLGEKDVLLLAVYSHMIDGGMYLPDYPLGHIIAFQIEQYLKGKNLGEEMQRMCALGNITPDAWMQSAVGAPISTAPLLSAAEEALTHVR